MLETVRDHQITYIWGSETFFPVISGAILNIEDVGKSYMNVSYEHCLASGTCLLSPLEKKEDN